MTIIVLTRQKKAIIFSKGKAVFREIRLNIVATINGGE